MDVFCGAMGGCISKAAKEQTKQKKTSRHWGTQIGGPQHDNLLTLKEANTEV